MRKYSYTAQVSRQVLKNLHENGTMARIDALAAQHKTAAESLGFVSAQQAYNKLGKPFLAYSKNPHYTDIAKAVAGFLGLVGLGWQASLALDCSFDAVFDRLEKIDFLNLCHAAVGNKQAAAQN